MALNLFYTMVQKSRKWPKTQIKGGCVREGRGAAWETAGGGGAAEEKKSKHHGKVIQTLLNLSKAFSKVNHNPLPGLGLL